MTEPLVCAHCSVPVAVDAEFCPGCRSRLQVIIFPALLRQHEVAMAADAQEGEAGCFYHPAKRAVVPCDQCGRFLCGLCQIDFLEQNWCPQCVQTASDKGRLSGLDAVRRLYGNAAIGLATVPLLFWPSTLLTAPMSLYVTFRYWNSPSSLVRRGRWLFYAATLFAVVELGGWVWLGALVVSRL